MKTDRDLQEDFENFAVERGADEYLLLSRLSGEYLAQETNEAFAYWKAAYTKGLEAGREQGEEAGYHRGFEEGYEVHDRMRGRLS